MMVAAQETFNIFLFINVEFYSHFILYLSVETVLIFSGFFYKSKVQKDSIYLKWKSFATL